MICPCGCGRELPDVLVTPIMTTEFVERWIQSIGLTMADVKRRDNRAQMVVVRRLIARYLREHGWSYPKIGEFIDRDHSTVMNLVNREGNSPLPGHLEVIG